MLDWVSLVLWVKMGLALPLFGAVSDYECSPEIQCVYPLIAFISSELTPCPQFNLSLFQAEYPMPLPRSRELTLIQSNYISCCYRV